MCQNQFIHQKSHLADPGGRAVQGMGLRVRIPRETWMSLLMYVVTYRSLQRADPSSREALPSACILEYDQVQQ